MTRVFNKRAAFHILTADNDKQYIYKNRFSSMLFFLTSLVKKKKKFF